MRKQSTCVGIGTLYRSTFGRRRLTLPGERMRQWLFLRIAMHGKVIQRDPFYRGLWERLNSLILFHIRFLILCLNLIYNLQSHRWERDIKCITHKHSLLNRSHYQLLRNLYMLVEEVRLGILFMQSQNLVSISQTILFLILTIHLGVFFEKKRDWI